MIRRIRLPHLHNFRDLGGYEAGSSATAWGRIFRSDCPSKLEADEWRRFSELGIKNIIDLRSTYEACGDPVSPPETIVYNHCRFFKEDDSIEDKELAARKFLDSLSLDYSFMMKNSLSEMAEILKVTVKCLSEGNVCFFCTAGKDRTGILAASILYLCGVSREDIIADYAVTEIYNADVIMGMINSLPEAMKSRLSPASLELAAASKADTMSRLLDWMDSNDFIALMDRNGFGKELSDTLRKQMLSSGSNHRVVNND
ncbi:MAG: tyrosine-protein phosphatase [Blautia sp.]|nr:tyrosine-protein phosphatase [Blautia sp.]